MGGWSSAESRIKNLGKKAEVVVKGKQVSVVYFDPVSGLIDWPINVGNGVLLVPQLMSESDWEMWVAEYAIKPIDFLK